MRYTDVKRTGYSGDVEFVFDTALNGVDMPDYYNIYMVDENGLQAESTYYYGAFEISDAVFSSEGQTVEKSELVNYKGKTVNVSLNVGNRTENDIKSVVFCGIYENNTLFELAMLELETLPKIRSAIFPSILKFPKISARNFPLKL